MVGQKQEVAERFQVVWPVALMARKVDVFNRWDETRKKAIEKRKFKFAEIFLGRPSDARLSESLLSQPYSHVT